MARLYRPHMPLSVKVEVAERAFAGFFPNGREPYDLLAPDWSLKRRLEWLMFQIARAIGCEPKDLRFDHDPALALRQACDGRQGHYYIPDANDPAHIFIRPHGAEFAGSHDVKTRIRGDRGQFSDIALINRERRRIRKKNTKKSGKRKSNFGGKTKWPKRKFPKKKN